ncbi:hypothetical protein [Aminipila sp.]|uniref:hypothetical protein n=1 Tax=Aminipila sp. TaxID=2060095 RepID=UPI00289AD65A|nr:hypothetical protein [Aminipila sp.]
MKKRKYIMISFTLILCLLFSTAITFAGNRSQNNQVIQTSADSFIANGEEYTIEKQECKTLTETKMYDSQNNLVGHMKYDKINGKLFDLLENKEISSKNIEKSNKRLTRKIDSEGYSYQGSYQIDLGYVAGTASLILTLTSGGIALGQAIAIAGAVTTYGASFIYIKGELWTKTDTQFNYVKKIENVYETVSEKNHKLGGPFTYRQKKAVDAA